MSYRFINYSAYASINSVIVSFYSQWILSIDNILEDSRKIFEDVHADFCDIRKILLKFQEWKEKFPDSYCDAYVSFCLPKLLNPLIRVELINWNPLEVGASSNFIFVEKLFVLYGRGDLLGFWVSPWSSRQCSVKRVTFLVCAVLVNLAFLPYSFSLVGDICEYFWQLKVWQGRGLLFAGKTSVWERCHLDCRGVPELEIKVCYLDGGGLFLPAKSFLYMIHFHPC